MYACTRLYRLLGVCTLQIIVSGQYTRGTSSVGLNIIYLIYIHDSILQQNSWAMQEAYLAFCQYSPNIIQN